MKNNLCFNNKKTKIICTIGPASDSIETIEKLIKSGMDIARLNFSHGTHEYHKENIKKIREVSDKLSYFVPIIGDLQGPKIRVGIFKNKEVILEKGQPFILTNRDILGDSNQVSVTYKDMPKDVSTGDTLLLDDGLLEFKVLSVKDQTDIICEVVIGGFLKNSKGINLPNTNLSLSSITEKDKKDIIFGIEEAVDYFALSFVRSSDNVKELRQLIHSKGVDIPIISKIEKNEAIEDIENIICASQAIMVARGDLGIESRAELVPIFQKRIIKLCNEYGKPVITATQMLDSMINNPRPTRAETTDVANAILDGSDAIMLSGETASGKYPIESVKMMTKIAKEVEPFFARPEVDISKSKYPVAEATMQAVVRAGESIDARFLICFTTGGATARLLSKYRSKIDTIAFTPNKEVARKLNIHKGIYCILAPECKNLDEMINLAEKELLDKKLISDKDYIIVTAGYPLASSGTTNLMRIHQVNNRNHIFKTYKLQINKDEIIYNFSLNEEECINCGVCQQVCPYDIFDISKKIANIKEENINKCSLDYMCVNRCPTKAISITKA